MEPASDKRFDPNYALQMLLDTTYEHSLENLLQKLVQRVVERPHVIACHIWMIEKGDLCAVCPQRPECADQSRCFHLVAAKENPVIVEAGKGLRRPGAIPNRFPLNADPMGKVVASGQQVFIADAKEQPATIPVPDWMREEGFRGGFIEPIYYKGEALGAIVSIAREPLDEESRPWGRVFAGHVGAAIANARAFDEIQRLKTQLEQQNAYLEEEVVEARAFGELVGQSAALRQIVKQIDLVAPTEASVLILGETGTGKELVAREIHRRSQRTDQPLVRVNCASIPKELFESEFFGHVRGSFTGAIKDRAGRFETAHGGTIFLDEIGEVPLEMQSKLLRVLQERRYERVGDDRTRFADVRIIAATNRDLKQAAAAGQFREDLYYRLNVFPISVSPLRERSDDIPLLAKHFVELSAKELRCAKPRLTKAAVARLQNYDWPGNIRELRNVIERAVILARGGNLEFDLPVAKALSAPAPPRSRVKAPDGATEPEFLTEAELQRRDRDNLVAILEKADWRIKGPDGAAELLGVKPTTLLARMKKWGIKRPAA